METIGIILTRITNWDKDLKLVKINGINSLEHIILSIKKIPQINKVIIAVPKDEFSDYFKQLADQYGCRVYTGDNNNITQRVQNSLSSFGYTEGLAVRLNGDMPFFRASLTQNLIKSHLNKKADYSHYDGMPSGIAPDIISIRALNKIDSCTTPYYRWIKSHPELYRINKISTQWNFDQLSLALNNSLDIAIFRNTLNEAKQNSSSNDLKNFFLLMRRIIKSLLENEKQLESIKYLNHKLNNIERGLGCEDVYSMPLRATVELYSGCNLRCEICYQQYPELTKNKFKEILDFEKVVGSIYVKEKDGNYRIEALPMSEEVYQKIACTLFPYLFNCSFGSAGEPLMNKRLLSFLETARQFKVSSHVVTNGTLIKDLCADHLFFELLDSIAISFDGATRETFEKIRRGANFKQILKNIDALQKMKEKFHTKSPTVSLAVTISKKNIDELPDIVTLASNYNLSSVGVRYAYFFKFMDTGDALIHHPEIVREKFMESIELAKKKQITLHLPKLVGSNNNENSLDCHIPWEEVWCDTQGWIKPCCHLKSTGNMVEKEFKKIWNCDYQKKVRSSFKSLLPELENCKNCTLEQYRNPNNIKSFIVSENNFPY